MKIKIRRVIRKCTSFQEINRKNNNKSKGERIKRNEFVEKKIFIKDLFDR